MQAFKVKAGPTGGLLVGDELLIEGVSYKVTTADGQIVTVEPVHPDSGEVPQESVPSYSLEALGGQVITGITSITPWTIIDKQDGETKSDQ